MDIVYPTALASLIVQVTLGIVSSAAFFLLSSRHASGGLRIILSLEFASQMVQLLWYVCAVLWFRSIITWTRYIGWAVSTPIMLTSMAMFFQLRQDRDVRSVVEDTNMWAVLVFSSLTLNVGFLLELGYLPASASVIAGAGCLVAAFTLLERFASRDDAWSYVIFFYVYSVWLLYAASSLLPYTQKNTGYNALDIATHLYGLSLLVYVEIS